MIKQITVTNPSGEKLVMPLSDPWSSGLNITNITGLGPSKGSVTTSEIATSDGSRFVGSRYQERNIVFSIDYMMQPSVEENRKKTYRFFPVKKQVELRIDTTLASYYTKGYVESNEPDIFSQRSGATISIICPDPFLYVFGKNGLSNNFSLSSVRGMFEFEWEDPVSTSPTIVFSEYIKQKEFEYFYDGEVETGMLIKIHILGPYGKIKISRVESGESIEINPSRYTKKDIGTGDDIIINSEIGSKRIELLSGGVTTNASSVMERGSSWLKLYPGPNTFSYLDSSGSDNFSIEISFKTASVGI